MGEETFMTFEDLFRALSESARRIDELTARVETLEAGYADLQFQLRQRESASLRDCLKRPAPPIFVDDAEECEGVAV